MRIDGLTRLEALAHGGAERDPAAAATEFETFLVAAVYKQAANGPRFSTLFGDAASGRMFREMWIERLVHDASGQTGGSIARALTATSTDGEPNDG